jgi:hypothetical protein
MKTAKTIIAINTDENAAIMANCDYFAVGDLFEILPALEKALAASKRRRQMGLRSRHAWHFTADIGMIVRGRKRAHIADIRPIGHASTNNRQRSRRV